MRAVAAIVLELPVLFLYLAHYRGGDRSGRVATGFIAYDMPSYMASAREFFDRGQFAFSYGNPFSPFYETPAIYFQPLTFALGGVFEATRLDPGLIFLVAGLIAGTITMYLAIALFDLLFGLNTIGTVFTLCCFVWGGGLLAMAGALMTWFKADGSMGTMVFRLDPGGGWWFLNFGRNLVYSTEAVYHLLVLALVLLLLKRRYASATAILALLSMSHPFTGIQFILIVLIWMLVERWWFANRDVPIPVVVAASAIGALHVGYYLGFLPSFPEHANLMQQWALPWLLELKSMLPAYGLVAGLVVWRWRNRSLFGSLTADPRNRLFVVWFVVSLALAKHDLFITPHQPVHFTRGYIWSSLFLLGAPVLIQWADRMWTRSLASRGLMAIVLVVFLADNTLWFALRMKRAAAEGTYVSVSEMDTLRWLNAEAPRDGLVVSDDVKLMYLTTVYTPLRSWISHWANTPFAEKREAEVARFFAQNVEPEEWRDRNLVVIRDGARQVLWRRGSR